MNQKLFSKDFTLVVAGQIISLFGNATVRFALPLYLLNLTGSSALYGTVMACAFIPSILLSPVGGIIADRVNKRNVMVVLDFFTAAVIALFSLLMGSVNLVVLLTVTLMILYGIAGAYQPSVQASIPALVDALYIMEANSIVNTISSIAALMGPVLGGILYSAYGLTSVLWVCTACFIFSAVMEIFIHIPYQKQKSDGSIWQIVKNDFAESLHYIRKENPIISKVMLAACGINLFLAAMITVAMPYLVTEVIDLETTWANRLYGFAQGMLAAGGLAGGICAGIFAKRLSIQKSGNLIVISALCLLPISASLLIVKSGMINYVILTLSCFAVMVCVSVFNVQVMSFFQTMTPAHLVGKVMALVITAAICAQPLGSALYGVLFEISKGVEWMVVLFACGVSMLAAFGVRKAFAGIVSQQEKNNL